MNKRYTRLFKLQVDDFLNQYNRSTEIFESVQKSNKLLHPGEFGQYREKAVADLLRFILPSKFEISNGFLINSYDETSSQCDIVVFNEKETPLIRLDDFTRFFPVESVVAVGEVKSDITQKNLIDALIKLARNKMLFRANEDYDSKDEVNYYYTFLICNKIKGFNPNSIIPKIEKAYDDNGIDIHHRHNIVISLEDGIISYQIPDDSYEPTVKKGTIMTTSTLKGKKLQPTVIMGNKYDRIRSFSCSISINIYLKHNFYADPVRYLF